jgi:CRP-like cAMP-binding protein
MHQKLVTLRKNAVLWEEGDQARHVAVLEKGKLGVRTSHGLVGLLWPHMVLGESALFAAQGRRTASVVALEDDTLVAEYLPEQVRDSLADGDDPLPQRILTTLVGQVSRNLLMVVASRRGWGYVDQPLTELVRGVVIEAERAQPLHSWEAFHQTASYLYELRDFSDRVLQTLGPEASRRAELIEGASAALRELFAGRAVVPALEDFLRAEREKSDWWARGY